MNINSGAEFLLALHVDYELHRNQFMKSEEVQEAIKGEYQKNYDALRSETTKNLIANRLGRDFIEYKNEINRMRMMEAYFKPYMDNPEKLLRFIRDLRSADSITVDGKAQNFHRIGQCKSVLPPPLQL